MLLALLLAALPVVGAEDQAADQDEVPGEVVVVEAQAAALDLHTVDEAEIARTGAETVATLLEQDVAVTASTGGRGERQFTLRGFDQRQVAVFLDGVPATVPYDGYQDLNRLPATMLGRVEIAPGPSAGIYGPHSLGGAVQLRTRPAPAEPEHLAILRAAAHGALDAAAYAGGPVGPLKVRVGGGGRSSPGDPLPLSFAPTSREDGGLRDNSDRRSEDAHLRADMDLGRGGNLSANANYLQGAWGVPGGLEESRPRYWRWSDYRDLSASLRHDGRPDARVRDGEVLWFGRNTNVLDSYDDASLSTQEGSGAWHSTYRDERVGGAATLRARPGTAPFSLGAWLFADHQVHHSQGDVGEAWEQIATTLMSGALTAETRTETWIEAFAGLELDAEIPGQGTAFAPAPLFLGPSLGVEIHPGDRLHTSLGVARRARAPTLKERFSEGMGYREPNLELGPERAWHFGWDLRVNPVEATALTLSLYDAEVSGLIEEVPLGDGLSQMQNVQRARLAGAEVGANAALPDWLESRLALGLLYARQLDVAAPDDRLEYRPGWQVRWVETLHLGDKLELRSNLRFVGAQWFLDDDTLVWGQLGTIWLWDAMVAFAPTTRSTLRIRAENLLDASYQTRFGYPDPGRTIWFEAEARL
ncbi:MAG: TonB-dependent receptor plug domain-containing protein [Pseudomonadota bacterium]